MLSNIEFLTFIKALIRYFNHLWFGQIDRGIVNLSVSLLFYFNGATELQINFLGLAVKLLLTLRVVFSFDGDNLFESAVLGVRIHLWVIVSDILIRGESIVELEFESSCLGRFIS